jgi:hypothetical protein
LSTSNPQDPAALTNPIQSHLNDPYDVNDPFTQNVQQRQQRKLSQPQATEQSSTQSSGSLRTLRRTPRLQTQESPQARRTHIEAASVGLSPSPPRVRFAEQQDRPSNYQRAPHESADDQDSTSTQQAHPPRGTRHPALQISKRTAAAILYTLEVALRSPNQFTPDLLEENASMSDLTGGAGPASTGNGRYGSNGGSRVHQPAPLPTGSPGGRIKGPTDIMRERNEREARKKAEREALEMQRARAEEETRLEEEDRRRRAAKRAAAAGVAGERSSGGEGYGSSGSAPAQGPRISDNSQTSERLSGGNTGAQAQDAPIQGRGRGGTALGGGEAANAAARPPRGPTVSQGQPRPVRPQTSGAGATQAGPSTAPAVSQPPPAQQSGESSAANTTRRSNQSSFPHAFERWETLSSHWEGLTGYWMRRLEANAEEIERDPLNTQLARQVTDLSAAGANLFHAVVELQRLRASSERKFQRWFYETRADQERSQEVTAMLEATLLEERRGRAEAIADAVARQSENSNSEKLIGELKRELLISKEEARRAWEELGRREQEERERTASLREGHPTLVGGVQVVPMMTGAPSRNVSTAKRPPHEGAYTSGPEEVDLAYDQSTRAQRVTDPFVENSRTYVPTRGTTTTSEAPTISMSKPLTMPEFSEAPAVQPPTTSASFYQQHRGTTLHPTEQALSEGTYSDTEYEVDPSGQFRRDSQGNKVRYSDPHSEDDTDELDVAADREQELRHLQQYGHAPVSSGSYAPGTSAAVVSGSSSRPEGSYGATSEAPDYSGQAYESDPWVSFPRHHHPTRLSDVLEEDERSRTDASHASQVSRSRD